MEWPGRMTLGTQSPSTVGKQFVQNHSETVGFDGSHPNTASYVTVGPYSISVTVLWGHTRAGTYRRRHKSSNNKLSFSAVIMDCTVFQYDAENNRSSSGGTLQYLCYCTVRSHKSWYIQTAALMINWVLPTGQSCCLISLARLVHKKNYLFPLLKRTG